MKDSRYRFAATQVTEGMLVELCMMIPAPGLRRAVARALWFDVIDQIGDGKLEALKAVADPERLDDKFDFTEEAFGEALRLVGYDDWQVEQRLRVHQIHRRYMAERRTLPEVDRVLTENRTNMSHYERFEYGKR